jgi:uncharacterized protein (DUF1330 family)
MKPIFLIIAAGVTGVLTGAAAIQTLHAQAKPPAYLISEIEVTDAPTYQTYVDGVNPVIAKHGGKFIVRGGKTLSVAGDPPKRVAVAIFESMDQAAAFEADPAYKALIPIRDKSSKYRGYIVEGAN